MALRDWNPFFPPRPPDSRAVTVALADLERLKSERPWLANACVSLGSILQAAFSDPVPEVIFEVEPDLLLNAWKSGVPAFRVGEKPPTLVADDIRARGRAVLETIRVENLHAKSLITAIRDGAIDLSVWAQDIVGDPSIALDARAETRGLNAALVRSALRLAMLPSLDFLSRRLAIPRAESSWTRGECPNCGSPPTMAESRGLEQRRRLRCGLCAADWEGERLRCPFCNETDHRKLSFVAVEGEQDRFRIALCDSCGGTLKVIATLGPISAPGLLVAELATTHLDQALSNLPDEGVLFTSA